MAEIRRHSPAAPWTYALLEARQAEIVARVRAGEPGALLLSELAPVITAGRRTDPRDLRTPGPPDAPAIPIHPVGRGGLATYHGPGQWVLFAVDRLERLAGDPRGVRKAVRILLEIALTVSRRYEPRAEIREGAELGVWTPRGKVAAVGIKVTQGIVTHGVSVNGFKTPESFQGLRPCGLDLPVDYLLPPSDSSRSFDRLGQEILAAARAVLTKLA